jgi:hypothetical protein
LEDLGADGRIILEWILNKSVGKCGLDYLAQDRDKWQAHVIAVKNLQVP